MYNSLSSGHVFHQKICKDPIGGKQLCLKVDITEIN